MNNQKLLSQRIKDLEASVAYFAPGNKRESERWVTDSFLQNLRILYSQSEVISPDDDPPDVEFRDARFEIKEILDPGRRRHEEYKQELERVRSLTDPKDLLQMFTPKGSTLEDIYRLCEQVALGLDKKYPLAVRRELDLLLYVNLSDVMYVGEQPYPDTTALASSGWRSISFVMGQRSCCFFAHNDAPVFIQKAVGHVSHLRPREDGT